MYFSLSKDDCVSQSQTLLGDYHYPRQYTTQIHPHEGDHDDSHRCQSYGVGDSLLRTTARHLHIVARCSCIQWFQERA